VAEITQAKGLGGEGGIEFGEEPGGMASGVNSFTTGRGSMSSPRAERRPLARSCARWER
jgi:hypothetical protein